jgi:hypothetical protein
MQTAAVIRVAAKESTAARRRVYFYITYAPDGLSPYPGIVSGQPQISVDGAAWTNTGIGTMTEIGNGWYYADLTQAICVQSTRISTRYKDSDSVECKGDTVIVQSIYQAKVTLTDDNSGGVDLYLVSIFKDGVPILSGITSPTIQVIKASDGSDLVASTALTQVASTGFYKKSEASSRVVSGSGYIAKVAATIDSTTLAWSQPVSRDST